MLFGIFCSILFTFSDFSSAKDAILSHCDSQLQILLNATPNFASGVEQRTYTVFCQIPNSVVLTSHWPFDLLGSFSEILPNCATFCVGCSVTHKPISTISSDGHSLTFGCLNSDQSSLTVLSVSLPYPYLVVLSIYRKPLMTPPPKVPKFRLFPHFDLRLPADFFFPFGCE
ncbi:hypothetical protein niasHT_037731 [Heterodera trifolii]|uniref:Uncharacterized protein n=1 Tax=Heterodera trifolii TaxID=157864 RepID=A0ABD2J7N4_9BILA